MQARNKVTFKRIQDEHSLYDYLLIILSICIFVVVVVFAFSLGVVAIDFFSAGVSDYYIGTRMWTIFVDKKINENR